MEGGKSQSGANMVQSASYGFLDSQGSMQAHPLPQNPHVYQSSMGPTQPHDAFNPRIGNCRDPDQRVSFLEYNRVEMAKASLSDDEDVNCAEEGTESGKGKKGSPWQRVKWTDKMVMLLITAVSYIGEDASDSGGGRRRALLLQKKGKWKTVSKVMAERGFYVSPQQCEDKFNDLNKRYKRLNDVLGRGTSCEVVEKPALLDRMEISEKAKEDVRKILNSKHLFYEQMCSYHNGNRLHLPHDFDLQRSLQLALRSRDDYEAPELRQHKGDDIDEDDQYAEAEDHDDEMEDLMLHKDNSAGTFVFPGSCSAKRMRQGEEYEDVGFVNPVNFLDCNKRADAYLQNDCIMNPEFSEGRKSDWSREQWMMGRSFQLEEKKLQIQEQMLELERQKLKWQRFQRKQEMELERMRLGNESIKLENERMLLELKRKGFNSTCN